ncbi:hypothetical protein [Klenkia taihuensis]|uniref:Uncharacterized protein n=1 Tax=Klenkia taihuensis TaxID=1225127 RepID=A0A1I1ISH6_9ACTN|nr:hypothetical protein [Klenkia taihuensis]GHE11290.1 hypothetical protein GCM10011381_24200 [Klenkia taihuensis]SFC39184.1 hypothetical protein SAMN05661030_0853 [Klenkia taihuensis]
MPHEPEPATRGDLPAHRVRWLAGALVATTVAVVLTVVGDGVPPVGTGTWGSLVDAGHAAAWGALAVAAWIATARGRWVGVCSVLAALALGLYLLFVGAVVL